MRRRCYSTVQTFAQPGTHNSSALQLNLARCHTLVSHWQCTPTRLVHSDKVSQDPGCACNINHTPWVVLRTVPLTILLSATARHHTQQLYNWEQPGHIITWIHRNWELTFYLSLFSTQQSCFAHLILYPIFKPESRTAHASHHQALIFLVAFLSTTTLWTVLHHLLQLLALPALPAEQFAAVYRCLPKIQVAKFEAIH